MVIRSASSEEKIDGSYQGTELANGDLQSRGSITKRFQETIDAVLKVFELANKDLQSYRPTFSVAVLLSQNLHRVRTKESNKTTPSPALDRLSQ